MPIPTILAGALLFVSLPAAFAQTGRVTGEVHLRGEPPPPTNHLVTTDLTVCGNTARAVQPVRLGPDRALAGAIVWVDIAPSPLGITNPPVTLDLQRCDILPRIQLARPGAPLFIRNHDPTLHLLQLDLLTGTNGVVPWQTIAAPYAGFAHTNTVPAVAAPAWLRVTSGNGRDWLTAWIAVIPHPWAAVTGDDGAFQLRAVPVGEHTVRAWHETLGQLEHRVSVTTAGTTRAQFEFTVSSQSPP